MGWRRAVGTVYIGCLRVLLGVTFRIFFRYRAQGLENLPRQGRIILAANHLSYFDPILVALPVHHPLRFMTWAALFGNRWFGAMIRSAGAFPVNVERWDVSAYRTALECLRRDEWLVIFPEGRRSNDGGPQRLKPGVAHLALRAGATIVPVRIEGSYNAWSRHMRWPRPFQRCTVRFSKPIPPPETGGKNPEARHAAAEDMMMRLKAELETPIEMGKK